MKWRFIPFEGDQVYYVDGPTLEEADNYNADFKKIIDSIKNQPKPARALQ